ncbi:alanine--tRNA ligase [bacterium]|nr:alanine--tRNA ligase [bacterium]
MKAIEIRQSFLDFFRQAGHTIVSSVPVVPQDDPTLLFTNAGMNQFKDVFLGTGNRPYKRVANSQKCIRVSGKHNDLEEVGHDTYHHTFFEMMGNWSFGDYYKKEAISWAWELVTSLWNLPKKNVWATVFKEDDESEQLWKDVTDIQHSHILRFDEKDNFWEMGETGPCGPCSEIHIDLGEGYCDRQHVRGHVCGVNSGCARFIELWNLVFIQYNRDPSGKLKGLPARHVDTGLGLERAVAVLQEKKSNYQTDLFIPIMDRIGEITGKPLGEDATLPSFRVIADHIRALAFAITDGAIPSNEGRGYVLRRILRRAARYGRNLDMHEPFIYRLVSPVVDVMASAYPELRERVQHTTLVIKSEEERFNEVLDRGIEIFEEVAAAIIKKGQKIIPGEEAFRLYDTYGFPLDLTELMAREKGLSVNHQSFDTSLEKQRRMARKAAKFSAVQQGEWDDVSSGSESTFVGYETTESKARIRKVRKDGDRIELILDQTPFYGEAGGQVGDRGEIVGDGFRVRIDDTQLQGDQIIHRGRIVEGGNVSQKPVQVKVNKQERLSTARNHTATHLLHKALKEVLGDHVNQAGSLVSPERLRFDFTHFEAMTPEQIDEVEKRVNLHVIEDLPVEKFEATLGEAKRMGATALFGEKYGETVRVVKVNDYSMELCGGTHLDRTGEIGYFRIMKEEGVAAGVRRIEAITGESADKVLREQKHILSQIQAMFKCREDEIEQRINALFEERKELQRKMKSAQKSSASSDMNRIIRKASRIDGIQVVSSSMVVDSVDELKNLGDQLRHQLQSGVGVLASVMGDKVQLLCIVTDDLIHEKHLHAGHMVREIARLVGGSGGGKAHMALAGGKDTDRLQEALKRVPEIVKKYMASSKT